MLALEQAGKWLKMNKRKYFVKLKALGNGLAIYLDKKALKHLRVCKDSDICLTFNKRRSITISKAAYSDTLIEELVAKLNDG